jgi:hypothetical protein
MSDYYEYDSGDNVLLGRQGSPDDGYDSTKGEEVQQVSPGATAQPDSSAAQVIPLDPSRCWFHHPVQHLADERYRPNRLKTEEKEIQTGLHLGSEQGKAGLDT